MGSPLQPDPSIAAPPDDPWRAEPEPTNLVALWRADEAPTPNEILSALGGLLDGEVVVLAAPAPDEAGVEWCRVVERPEPSAPLIVWCEPSAATPPAELLKEGVRETAWVLGFETLVGPDDPISDYRRLMRFILRDLPGVPAVLDVNTMTWYARRQLEELFDAGEVEPPADVLWVTHVVRSDHAGGDKVWLHTHGLLRCGVPELEMLEVSGECAATAAGLVGDIGAMLLESAPPPPGAPLTIGPDLTVTLQPWSAVAPYLDDGVPGGMHDRADDARAHVGSRAVICDPVAVGSFRKLWVWPRDVTERLLRDEVCLFQTTRATERQSKLARRQWGQFARAFSGALASPATFGVKAGFKQEDDAASREHLWFEVCRIEENRVQGRLVHEPHDVATLRRGDLAWIDLDEVSDWRVMNDRGSFGPEDVPAMWRALRRRDAEPGDGSTVQ